MSLKFNPLSGELNFAPVGGGGGGGSGDVVGPSGATDNAIVRFDTTTGKLIQNSAVTIADTTGILSVNGTQTVFVPDQSTFIGSMFFGNGGGSISHVGSGDAENLTAFGQFALFSNTTGGYNVAIGRALQNNTIGSNNLAIGAFSLHANIDGGNNTAVGAYALNSNEFGFNNVGIGNSSLVSHQSGYYNIGIGRDSLSNLTSGNSNVGIGYLAGKFIANGSTANATSNNSVFIGDSTKALASGQTNQIAIGYDVIGNGSNTVTIGNANILGNYFKGTINLTAQTAPAHASGQLFFDSAENALTFHNSNSNVALQIGEENRLLVVNNTGSTIANGVPVYINGQSGGMPTIALALNTSVATAKVLGLTTESIANGTTGYVTTFGKVRNFNTSAFSVGAIVYLGATAGSLTATAPTGSTAPVVRIGQVVVSNATTGVIQMQLENTPLANIQSATIDLGTAMANLGLRSTGSAYPFTTSGVVTFNGIYKQVPIARIASVTLNNTNSPQYNLCDATTASFTITLPAASGNSGIIFSFLKTDATANTVTIDANASETINGALTKVLSTQYQVAHIQCNGTAWFIWGE